MTSNSNKTAEIGAKCHASVPKVSGELFCLTYGALVSQLLKDYRKDVSKVNAKLFEMGKDIGTRMVDEVLSLSHIRSCGTFDITVEIVAKIGFKLFLGVTPDIRKPLSSENLPNVENIDKKTIHLATKSNSGGDKDLVVEKVELSIGDTESKASDPGSEFELVFNENPIERFVELPEELKGLKYSIVYCGAIVGALEAVSIEAESFVVSDRLSGDEVTRISIKHISQVEETAGDDYKEK